MSNLQNHVQARLLRAWQQRDWLACLLWPVSLLFWLIQALRRALYAAGVFQTVMLPVPVIVVGNIFVGGTGKTPLVIWLVHQLRLHGFVPGVISRGYGNNTDAVQAVTARMSPQEAGDEPLLIVKKTGVPLIIGRKRVAAARALLSAHPEVNVIISDDGLQHYALGRAIEIQLSDSRGHGNGWLLPAGPLREPVSRKSNFYVINGGQTITENTFGMQLDGAYVEQLTDRNQRMIFAELAAKKNIAAVAGIGNPQRFFAMLRAKGLTLATTQALPAHFDFSFNPFKSITADIILITEKDAVKCATSTDTISQDQRLWVVPVEATLDAALIKNIVEKLRGHTTA